MKAVMKVVGMVVDILLAVLVITAMAIVVPYLFGVRTLAVLSGSMEPNYPVGSMVYAVPTAPENIEPGDPISFVLNDRGTVVTHRVVQANREAESFIVRGDANNTDDPKPVIYENVIGVVRFHIPFLGYILSFVLTTSGKIITGTVIVSLILLTLLLGGKEKEPEERTPGNTPERDPVPVEEQRMPAQPDIDTAPAGKKNQKAIPYSRKKRYISKYAEAQYTQKNG